MDNRVEPHAPSVAGIRPWWRELNGYHWFVFLLAAFGWMFDCFDQQIFTNSRSITMQDLLPQADSLTQVKFGTWATSIFILGWATGGLIFGTIGDKWGRAKTMAVTILVYAVCTGLSGFARTWSTFALFRFLTGAGVGGEFAVGAALLAEVMPDRARPHALGSLQALSAIGNILAAVSLGIVVPGDKLGWGWRGLYYLGALPALIAVFVFSRLREPDRWVAAKAAARSVHRTVWQTERSFHESTLAAPHARWAWPGHRRSDWTLGRRVLHARVDRLRHPHDRAPDSPEDGNHPRGQYRRGPRRRAPCAGREREAEIRQLPGARFTARREVR